MMMMIYRFHHFLAPPVFELITSCLLLSDADQTLMLFDANGVFYCCVTVRTPVHHMHTPTDTTSSWLVSRSLRSATSAASCFGQSCS